MAGLKVSKHCFFGFVLISLSQSEAHPTQGGCPQGNVQLAVHSSVPSALERHGSIATHCPRDIKSIPRKRKLPK